MPLPVDIKKREYMFSDDMKFLQKAIVLHPTEKEKFLALKRWPGDRSRPGKWDLVGGNLHFGQETEDGLRREIREESGLEIKDSKPIQVWSKYYQETKTYHLFIGYVCTATSDNVKLSHEHTEYRWVTREEFKKLESADFLLQLVNLL